MLKIKMICSQCGEKVDLRWIEEGLLEVDPCDCNQQLRENTDITMYYGDLLEHLGSKKVLVSYFKKDGDYRTLVGFLGVPVEGKVFGRHPDLVYFVEKEYDDDEAEVKCLIKKNIASITDIDAQQRYKVMGGLIND